MLADPLGRAVVRIEGGGPLGQPAELAAQLVKLGPPLWGLGSLTDATGGPVVPS
jgi:hypothetical protein